MSAAYERDGDDTLRCDAPPKGWRCTRPRGHDGPCAAHPTADLPLVERHFAQRPMSSLTEHELDVLTVLGRVQVFSPHIESGLSTLAELAERELADRDLAFEDAADAVAPASGDPADPVQGRGR